MLTVAVDIVKDPALDEDDAEISNISSISRYSVYLLYWHTSTNADSSSSSNKVYEALSY